MSKIGATIRDLTSRAGTRATRGFTLVEVVISIGAVAIVTVGLAAIFRTIGETVTQGQKVSALTQTAALLEQQMRRDFSTMTRDGFLVVRSQFAGPRNGGANQEIGINRDDPNPRFRRVDEILFFTKGEYETARAPVNPSIVARGDTAQVYYGHTLQNRKRQDNASGDLDDRDVRPSISSLNDPDPGAGNAPNGRPELSLFGGGGTFGETLNGRPLPNTYAENWALVRKRTILATPKTVREATPARGWPEALRVDAAGLAPVSRVSDSDIQISTQPAASSIFRSLAREVGPANTGSVIRDGIVIRPARGQGGDAGAGFPQISSGLVDLATTDLSEIRSIVQTFNVYPWDNNLRDKYDSVQYQSSANYSNDHWEAQYTVTPGQVDALVNRMHAWMRDAMPTQSDRHGLRGANNTPIADRSEDPRAARVRAELSPPDYLNVLTDLQGQGGNVAVALQSRRADQTMLTHGVIAARCTEFIVEWSFGEQDLNDPQAGNGVSVLHWYGVTDQNQRFKQYDDSQIDERHQPFTGRSGLATAVADHKVESELIYGSPVPNDQVSQTACFGYLDPYYEIRNQIQDGRLKDTAPTVLPWAWPKLIRVTVVLTDERDPLREERFQWVFETPGTPDPR
jgi:type II secretory pathway pseudopilin PulG